jgi:hypothetical protein
VVVPCTAADTTYLSSRADALKYIESLRKLEKSKYWPSITPDAFIRNIKEDILNPLALYQGSNTNFCGYAALSYLPLHHDPLGHAQKLVKLYQTGEVKYGKVTLKPTPAIRKAAGTIRFKGALDIRIAEQMWFLTLSDHFKGYINLFNRRYDPGDEDTFWAAVNYAKFNRMIRKLFDYKVDARGSDLIHPRVGDVYSYLKEKLKQDGTTIVYQNNVYLRKKNTSKVKPGYPTHYIVLLSIDKTPEDLITMIYWDYGYKSLRQVSTATLEKIVFGISFVSLKKEEND